MTSAQKGFTLVELLIVVSIITVMTGGLLPGFSGYITNQGLRQAVEQVEDDLRTLENKALSGDSALEEVNSNTAVYWGARFVQGEDKYQYFISDTNDGCYPANYNSKGSSIKLPGDNVIRTTTRCVFFSFENSNANMRSVTGSISLPAPVIIGQSAGITCGRVQINSAGLIEVLTNTGCL